MKAQLKRAALARGRKGSEQEGVGGRGEGSEHIWASFKRRKLNFMMPWPASWPFGRVQVAVAVAVGVAVAVAAVA